MGWKFSAYKKSKFFQQLLRYYLQFHLWDEIGWQGIRSLMEAAMQAKYKHCSSIRLWRTKCEDEGVRLIMQFMS